MHNLVGWLIILNHSCLQNNFPESLSSWSWKGVIQKKMGKHTSCTQGSVFQMFLTTTKTLWKYYTTWFQPSHTWIVNLLNQQEFELVITFINYLGCRSVLKGSTTENSANALMARQLLCLSIFKPGVLNPGDTIIQPPVPKAGCHQHLQLRNMTKGVQRYLLYILFWASWWHPTGHCGNFDLSATSQNHINYVHQSDNWQKSQQWIAAS